MSSDFAADRPYEHLMPPDGTNNPNVIANRYELLELVGRGASSRIYRARDRALHRIVAVKLLRDEYRADKNSLLRFEREARSVASLSNPYIVDVYDYGEHQDTYYIVMQYIEGLNLKDLLRREGSLPPSQVVSITSQVLLALATAHSQGIIHRDIKPQNILIQASNGAVKLADFGVAHTLNTSTITTIGTPIGTVHYMAPEQASGGKIGPATDIYAVGVVLYELLSGQLPFQGSNQMQIALQHIYDPPPTFSSLGVSVPPRLEQVTRQALAKDPAQRYQSADEMRLALATAATPEPSQRIIGTQPLTRSAPINATTQTELPARPVDETTPKRSKAKFLLPLGLALLVLLAGTVVWFSFSGSANPASPTQQAAVTQARATPPPSLNIVALAPPPTATATIIAATNTPNVAASSAATPLPLLATITPAPSPTSRPSPTQTRTATSGAAQVPGATASTATQASEAQPNLIRAYDLSGAYKRDDGTLYGLPQIALYGAGSTYNEGTVNLTAVTIPSSDRKIFLVLSGLDDERNERCNLQVLLNGMIIFDGPNTFPNVPNGDNGVGGNERYWGEMSIAVPNNALKAGANTLTVRNTTPSLGYLGPPYMLISAIEFELRS